jgi:perosamine synthetase
LIADRRRVARLYDQILSQVEGISKPFVADYCTHTYQCYVSTVADPKLNRDEIISKLRKEGVEAQIGTYCLHTQPCYEGIIDRLGENLLNAERAYETSLALPIYYGMTEEDVSQVISSLKKVIKSH